LLLAFSWSRLSAMRQGLTSRTMGLGFLAACCTLAGVSFGTYWSTQRLLRSYAAVADTHQVGQKIMAIDSQIKAAQNSVYNFVITGREERLDIYHRAQVQIPKRLRELESQVKGHAKQKSALRDFRRLYAVHQDYLAKIVATRRSDGAAAAGQWVEAEDGQSIRDVLAVLLDEVQSEQGKVLRRRSAVTFERLVKTRWMLLGAFGALLMLIVWVFGLLRRESDERQAAQYTNVRLETFLRSIIERTPYMVLVKEAETLRVTLVNRAATEWLGRSEADLLGSNNYDLMPKEEARRRTEEDRTALREGNVLDIPEEVLVRDGKEERILHTQKVAIPDENGAPAFLLTISEDITLRKQAQHMVEVSRDAAVQSERLKAEFIRNMSHEIRTPLTIVLGNAQRLMESGLTDEQRAVAARVERAAGALTQLAKGILEYSRMETGTFSLEPRDMNLRQMIDQIVAMHQEQAKIKGVALVALISPSVPATVVGDPNRVGEILTELVGNAMKFTARGEVIVRVVETEGPGDSLWLNLKVSDTGIGIGSEAQEHLFEPFRQGDGSPTRRYGGTGLGLAICKRLVELMGGNIGFSSAPNEGSTFWATLPFRRVTANSVQPTPPSAAVPSPHTPSFRQSAA
jgi:PAS domain S-box-containing protein